MVTKKRVIPEVDIYRTAVAGALPHQIQPISPPMALELHHRIVVIRFQRLVTSLGIALEEPSFAIRLMSRLTILWFNMVIR